MAAHRYFGGDGGGGTFPKDNNNEQIKKERQKSIERYVIDINNKLAELCEFLHLDLKDIKKINPNHYGSEKTWKDEFGDKEKKIIISSIIAEEENKHLDKPLSPYDNRPRQTSDEASVQRMLNSAGITQKQLDWLNYNDAEQARKAFKEQFERKEKEVYSGSTTLDEVFFEFEIKNNINKSKGEPQAPPKTDWKRVGISKDEKDKILASVRANPTSKIFSKEFKWNPKEFVGAFSYLEEAANYNGPFIISIVSQKEDLDKYSNIPKISEGINKMYVGKYLLLSIYDITASEKNINEAKYIYLGLNYFGMEGKLKFDAIGSFSGKIKNSQKILVKEFMDKMNIDYDNNHEDLTINL